MSPADLGKLARRLPYSEKRALLVAIARDLIGAKGAPTNGRQGTDYTTGSRADDVRALIIADIEMVGRGYDIARQSTTAYMADIADDPLTEEIK